MEFSLSAAAKATGKGKSTIHHAVKTGKLSARRCDDGSYRIDAAELARVFPLNPPEQGSKTAERDDLEPMAEPQGKELAELRVKVAMLEDQLGRERETVANLWKRFDEEQAERRALQRQITFQADQGKAAPRKTGGILQRLLGLA